MTSSWRICLFRKGQVEITDFGRSALAPTTGDIVPGSGTYSYLPPECVAPGTRILPKADVWSAGVIIFEIFFGWRPFGDGFSQV